jgi:thiamine-monophosphate kinase
MKATVAETGELELVAEICRRCSVEGHDIELGPGDDAAIWQPEGTVVATVDSIVCGTDWLDGHTPAADIGHRAIAVSLSDLAAMGAQPQVALLALQARPTTPVDRLLASVDGLVKTARRFGVRLLGGDLGIGATESWTVTALGCLAGPAMRRDAGQSGDAVWLVGEVGAAAVGLAALRSMTSSPQLKACIGRHLRPEPLVAAGVALQTSGHRIAAIDVSDGLWLDAERLAKASEVRLELTIDRPRWATDPVTAFCRQQGLNWRDAVAGGGDDYALLLTVAPDIEVSEIIDAYCCEAKTPMPKARRIGRVSPAGSNKSALVSITIDGLQMSGPVQGYQHGRA